jgi:hypothetical protein
MVLPSHTLYCRAKATLNCKNKEYYVVTILRYFNGTLYYFPKRCKQPLTVKFNEAQILLTQFILLNALTAFMRCNKVEHV